MFLGNSHIIVNQTRTSGSCHLLTYLYKTLLFYYNKYKMELPLFKFNFVITEQWLHRYQEAFDFYATLLPNSISYSEIKTIEKLLEDWMNSIRIHSITNEKKEAYEEYQVTYKFPRYIVNAIVGIKQT